VELDESDFLLLVMLCKRATDAQSAGDTGEEESELDSPRPTMMRSSMVGMDKSRTFLSFFHFFRFSSRSSSPKALTWR
jgi:hypothetical protein